ncbi:MAG: DUF3239 domain-containing protein [Thermoguttaceae bacterium]|jgi:hypothetical protein|nr:DUF3239 domain-containing protein [Thermoguttaceae bacterium]
MYVASNPVRVRMNVVHFLKSDLKDLVILAGVVVLSGIIAVYNLWAALVVLGIGATTVVMSVIQARSAFAEGDACPAIVVDSQQNLIAVHTDLSKGGPSHPVLQILKQPLGRVTGGPFKPGTRLVFAALYNGFPAESNWRGFGGYLVNAGTRDKGVIERVVRRIPETQWAMLEAAVEMMQPPLRPGLYQLDPA